jgi:hypothetical protein
MSRFAVPECGVRPPNNVRARTRPETASSFP